MIITISDFHFHFAPRPLPFPGLCELGRDQVPHSPTASAAIARPVPITCPAFMDERTPGVIRVRQDERSRGYRPSRGFVDGFPVGMGTVHPGDRKPPPSVCVSADTASLRAMGCRQEPGQGWTESLHLLPTPNWGIGTVHGFRPKCGGFSSRPRTGLRRLRGTVTSSPASSMSVLRPFEGGRK